MRKRTYLPLLALALFLCHGASSQRSPFVPALNHLQSENFKGAVKAVNAKRFSIQGIVGTNYSAYQLNHIVSSFDPRGNMTLEEKFNDDSTTRYKRVLHYNSQGFYTGYTSYNNDEVSIKSVLKLDEKGNVIEKKLFGLDGKIAWREVIALDAAGRKKEMWEYSKEDILSKRTLFYNSKEDNKAAKRGYGKEGGFLDWYEYSFNDNGLITKEMQYNEDGTPKAISSFAYDGRGNLLEKAVAAFSTIRNVYTYDEKDNMTSEKMYDKQGQLVQTKFYAYTYDANGNWLKKLEYFNGELKVLEERKISYY